MNQNTFHALRRHVKMEARADKPVTIRMNASVHQVSETEKNVHIYSNILYAANSKLFKNRNSNVVRTIIYH